MIKNFFFFKEGYYILYKYIFDNFLKKNFFFFFFIFDKLDRDFLKFYNKYKYKALSKSYLLEDIIVLFLFRLKKKGLFFEAGATDGRKHSNTYLLEKKYGWSGILVEPIKSQFILLRKNRKNNKNFFYNCAIGSKNKKQVMFYENITDSQLSSKIIYNKSHLVKKTYVVQKNINSIFKKKNLSLKQNNIDFFSLDINGTDLEVLEIFDFKKFSPKVFCIEVNSDNRIIKKLDKIFLKNSYKVIFEKTFSSIYSGNRWYIHSSMNIL